MDADYISRSLKLVDQNGRKNSIKDTDLLQSFSGYNLVVLAEPGMGKTRLMSTLGKESNCQFYKAASFLRQRSEIRSPTTTYVIDALDEVASVKEGDPLQHVLEKLIDIGKPSFIISCRSAEWNNVIGRVHIQEEYGVAPQELSLEPLTTEDVILCLKTHIGKKEADDVISNLIHTGFSHLYENPLSLNLVVSILRNGQKIPDTKAELYDLAIDNLWQEHNPENNNGELANLPRDTILNATGLIMAALLITGKEGVGHQVNSDTVLPISELATFDGNITRNTLKAVLGSRFFRQDTPIARAYLFRCTVLLRNFSPQDGCPAWNNKAIIQAEQSNVYGQLWHGMAVSHHPYVGCVLGCPNLAIPY